MIRINEEKPRRGVFEIRVDGTPVVTTGPEPRPFQELKALDITEIAEAAAAAASAAVAAKEE